MDPNLAQLQSQSQYLIALVSITGVMLVLMIVMVIALWRGMTQMQALVERKLAEWEPRLEAMDRQFQELRVEAMSSMETAQNSMVQANELMTRVSTTIDEMTPKVHAITDDARQLVAQVRSGVNELERSVVPKMRMVGNVANAVREGIGMFHNLRNNQSGIKRR